MFKETNTNNSSTVYCMEEGWEEIIKNTMTTTVGETRCVWNISNTWIDGKEVDGVAGES